MRRARPSLASLALLAFLAAPPTAAPTDGEPPGRAEGATDPAALVAGHFERLYAFNAMEAYEAIRAGSTAEFVIYRRWREGGVDLVLDVVRPAAADKWAYLFLQNTGRPDDFFIYVPNLPEGFTSPLGGPGRRVERFDASNQELDLPVILTPLREFRPFLEEELEFERVGEEEIRGVPCDVILARLRERNTLLGSVELAVSREHGISLRNRYFSGDREVRRVEIIPENVRVEGERTVVMERRLLGAGGEETLLRLKNYVLDADLPERLFSAHSIQVQRFPRF